MAKKGLSKLIIAKYSHSDGILLIQKVTSLKR